MEHYTKNSCTERWANSYLAEPEGDSRMRQVHVPCDHAWSACISLTRDGKSLRRAEVTLATRWPCDGSAYEETNCPIA